MQVPLSPTAPAAPEGDATPYTQALDELIALGMDLARLVHAEAHATAQANAATRAASASHDAADAAAAAPMPAPVPDPSAPFAAPFATAFDRIARAVRRTVLLAQHLAQHEAAHQARTATQPDPAQAHAQARTRARKQLIRGIENLITHNRQGPTAEALHREFMDRLDTPDLLESLDDDLAHRPVPEIVIEICEDLGVFNTQGHTRNHPRTTDDLRRLHARAQGHVHGRALPEPPWPTPQPRSRHDPQAAPDDIPPELVRMASLLARP